jgi:hypothetical protein
MRQLWVFIFSVFLASALTFSSSTAEAGKGALLTDRQIGHVFGGEANVCGPIKREACAPPGKERALSGIILWDEWGSQPGTPKHSAPGRSWSVGKGKVSLQSNVRIGN